jgi:hypothetical protein
VATASSTVVPGGSASTPPIVTDWPDNQIVCQIPFCPQVSSPTPEPSPWNGTNI